MHILLTDVLTCPRCGPAFGLILLADRIEDRRVLEGTLGCPNCREQYPVRAGFGTFGSGWSAEADGSAEDALRLAALLGVTEPGGFVLLAGAHASLAAGVADLIPGLEVVAASDTARAWPERPGVSRIGVAQTLPFLDRRLRGIALRGDAAGALLDEAARTLAPMGRLVLQDAPAGSADRLAALGLHTLAAQDDTIVAARA